VTAVEVLDFIVHGVVLVTTLVAMRLWWQTRSTAAAWMSATFLVFSAVILTGYLDLDGYIVRMQLLALMAGPYFLFRFAAAISGRHATLRRIVNGAFGLVVVLTLGLPTFPDLEAGPSDPVGFAYLVLLLTVWGGCGLLAAGLLLQGARGQGRLVRTRLRTFAVATAALALFIPAMSAAPDDSAIADVASSVLTLVMMLLFLLAFAPPGLLRSALRQHDERDMYGSAVAFLSATDPGHVARVLVPAVRRVMGAKSAVLTAEDGRVVTRDDAPNADDRLGEVVRRELGEFTLEVELTPAVPLFGEEEQDLMGRMVLLADLALDRVRLLAAEEEARKELESAYLELERANAELESFVYTTSHDLKNPVLAVIGYLDVIREDHLHELPPQVISHIERMTINAAHMDALIRDLLALSRIGRIDVTPEHVDLERMVDDVASDVASRHPDMRVERGDLPDLWMNSTRVRQLLTNLFDNAARYSGRDDVTVTVTAEDLDDGGARIRVRDNGRGIPEEHLERIFGVFERLDPDALGGTGMGLTICRRIAESVDGNMGAEPYDGGASFLIDLPATALARGREPSIVMTLPDLDRTPS
jgi:signal transduction histidine kinase